MNGKSINLSYQPNDPTMKIFYILLFIFGITFSISGQITNYSENEISNYIQSLIGGEREVRVKSGRADLMVGEHVFEVEWANKWKESIGQSLWYALQLNKKPGIILLMRSPKDYKYYIQLNSALDYADLSEKIVVLRFPDDFQKIIDEQEKK